MTITPFKWRSEYGVNTETANGQVDPDVAVLGGGAYVVVWQDFSGIGGDTSSSGVKARMYDEFGDPQGGEFLVNTTTAGSQSNPSITALTGGGFVVTYFSANALNAQIFGAGGNFVGSEITVNASATSLVDTSNVAALDTGGFIVTWAEIISSGDTDIRVRRYQADGTPIDATEIVVNTTPDDQAHPEVTPLAGGAFVVIWEDLHDTGTGRDIKGQRFDAAGAPAGGEFTVNSTTAGIQSFPAVTALNNGNFVAVWQDGPSSTIEARIFNANGTPVGNQFSVSSPGTSSAQVEPLADGGFLVAWRHGSPDGDVQAQRYDSTGTAVGTVITVHTFTTGSQESPNLAVTDDGRVVVVWDDDQTVLHDPDPKGIRSQILSLTNDNDFVGTSAGQAINGNANANVIYGDGGDDLIDGMGGDDLIGGGSGNDTLIGGGGADRFDGGADVDTIDYSNNTLDSTIDVAAGTADFGVVFETFVNVENFLLGSGDDTLFGSSVTNEIRGGDGDDTILMGNGAGSSFPSPGTGDQFFGEDGDDTIGFALAGVGQGDLGSGHLFDGGDDTDTFVFEAYSSNYRADLIEQTFGTLGDTVYAILLNFENVSAGNGDDELGGNDLANVLNGNAGDDTLAGKGGSDTLNGGDGDDLLIGGAGTDSFDGGDDTDTIDYTNNTANSTIDLVAGTADFGGGLVESFVNVENFLLGSGNDTITGDAENNRFEGNAGNDTLNGGAGDDILIGGIGNDTYHVDSAGDTVTEAADEGTDDLIFSSVSLTNALNVESLILNGVANLNATGLDGQDERISGNSGNNILDGAGGDDTLSPGDGADIADGGAGDDRLIYNGAVGTSGFDMFDGGTGVDIADFSPFGAAVWVDLGYSGSEAWTKDTTDLLTGTWREIADLNAIEGVIGSVFSDQLFGDGGENTLGYTGPVLTSGFDEFDGRGGSDTASFTDFDAAVWVDLGYSGSEAWTKDTADLLTGTWREIADLNNIENIIGTAQADDLSGDGGDNILGYTGPVLTSGFDEFDGRGGSDTASFTDFDAAVWVDLGYSGSEAWTKDTADLLTGTWREIADLNNIENIVGTAHADDLSGDGGENTLGYTGPVLISGFDELDGRGGSDTASFVDFGAAVWVDLGYSGSEAWTKDTTDLLTGTWREIADLINIENIIGTAQADDLSGDGGDNILGYTGPVLNSGFDELDGRGGSDTASFVDFGAAVWVDLGYSGSEAWTKDTADLSTGTWREIADLAAIENIYGSAFNDLIAGSSGTSGDFFGGGGSDAITGLGSDDRALYEGPMSDYSVTDHGGGSYTVTHLATGDTDSLTGIDQLVFDFMM